MKYFVGAVLALLVAVVLLPVQNASARNTNNFSISLYEINYELTRDSSNRSSLQTVETITAEFPSFNQNHGIERALPSSYDGHLTHISIDSITNATGQNIEYSTRDENGFKTLRIGNADTYVHGTQTYILKYTQHDVTKSFGDTGRDEWYWDTNGTGWKVPINELRVTATIDQSLVPSREGDPACYIGAFGANDMCVLAQGANEGVYSGVFSNLSAGENVTIAVGFKKGTFAGYRASLFEILAGIWVVVAVVTAVVSVIIFILLTVAFYRRRNRSKDLGPIAAEYIPPRNVSVLVSSKVVDTAVSVFSAQLIDFAVRHYIEIIETKPKGAWTAAQYDIKVITDPSTLLAEEREILDDMFEHTAVVGDQISLESLKTNYAYMTRTRDNDAKLQKLIEGEYAIREKSPVASKYFYKWAIALCIAGVIMLSPFVLFFAGVIALYGLLLRPLTDKGLALRRYILGLDKYIKAAEVERLAFLQGPDTAQKVGVAVDPNNPAQLVKLYERVLPYAILFGREKEWTKRLGDFYTTTQTQPGWYSGTTPFNAAVFGASISSFSQSASYSGGSSSSSGGSSGGGSSGGGGGGGGGGGW